MQKIHPSQPFWIGGNQFGVQSISVDNSAAIPLLADVHSALSAEDHTILMNRWLSLSSDYKKSDFSRQNRNKIEGLAYEICLGDTEGEVQKKFLEKVQRPRNMPDISMIYDPIFSTWAIYKQSIDEVKLREFFEAIKENGYRASNVEVNDGYEIGYGDHSFVMGLKF